MNLEPYESAWRDQSAPPPVALTNRALRSHRGRMAVLILATIHSLGAIVIAFRNASFSPITLALPFLAIGVLALLIRRQLRLRQAWRDGTATVFEALKLSLQDVNQEFANQKTLGLYAAATVPLFAMLLYQLGESGKMDQNAVVSLSLILAAVFLVNGIAFWLRRRYKLIPRRDQLQRILAQLQ